MAGTKFHENDNKIARSQEKSIDRHAQTIAIRRLDKPEKTRTNYGFPRISQTRTSTIQMDSISSDSNQKSATTKISIQRQTDTNRNIGSGIIKKNTGVDREERNGKEPSFRATTIRKLWGCEPRWLWFPCIIRPIRNQFRSDSRQTREQILGDDIINIELQGAAGRGDGFERTVPLALERKITETIDDEGDQTSVQSTRRIYDSNCFPLQNRQHNSDVLSQEIDGTSETPEEINRTNSANAGSIGNHSRSLPRARSRERSVRHVIQARKAHVGSLSQKGSDNNDHESNRFSRFRFIRNKMESSNEDVRQSKQRSTSTHNRWITNGSNRHKRIRISSSSNDRKIIGQTKGNESKTGFGNPTLAIPAVVEHGNGNDGSNTNIDSNNSERAGTQAATERENEPVAKMESHCVDFIRNSLKRMHISADAVHAIAASWSAGSIGKIDSQWSAFARWANKQKGIDYGNIEDLRSTLINYMASRTDFAASSHSTVTSQINTVLKVVFNREYQLQHYKKGILNSKALSAPRPGKELKTPSIPRRPGGKTFMLTKNIPSKKRKRAESDEDDYDGGSDKEDPASKDGGKTWSMRRLIYWLLTLPDNQNLTPTRLRLKLIALFVLFIGSRAGELTKMCRNAPFSIQDAVIDFDKCPEACAIAMPYPKEAKIAVWSSRMYLLPQNSQKIDLISTRDYYITQTQKFVKAKDIYTLDRVRVTPLFYTIPTLYAPASPLKATTMRSIVKHCLLKAIGLKSSDWWSHSVRQSFASFYFYDLHACKEWIMNQGRWSAWSLIQDCYLKEIEEVRTSDSWANLDIELTLLRPVRTHHWSYDMKNGWQTVKLKLSNQEPVRPTINVAAAAVLEPPIVLSDNDYNESTEKKSTDTVVAAMETELDGIEQKLPSPENPLVEQGKGPTQSIDRPIQNVTDPSSPALRKSTRAYRLPNKLRNNSSFGLSEDPIIRLKQLKEQDKDDEEMDRNTSS